MVMVVGADIGRSNSKLISRHFQNNFKTCSKVSDGGFNLTKTIEIDGFRYSIGKIGNCINIDDKSKDRTFKACLINGLNSIGTEETDFHIVTGLPISHYNKYKDNIIKEFKDKSFEVKSNLGSKIINIKNVEVLPEGIYCIDEDELSKDILIIDIGGLTVDVAHYKSGELVGAVSYEKGVRKLYSSIADRLNKKHAMDFDMDDIETAFSKGFYVVDNKEVEIDFEDYRIEHLQDIVASVRHDFGWKKIMKKFVGGGSLLFKDILEEANIEVAEDSCYANALAFYNKGVEKYAKHP